MDGAAKFVKGDAIAGILILVITTSWIYNISVMHDLVMSGLKTYIFPWYCLATNSIIVTLRWLLLGNEYPIRFMDRYQNRWAYRSMVPVQFFLLVYSRYAKYIIFDWCICETDYSLVYLQKWWINQRRTTEQKMKKKISKHWIDEVSDNAQYLGSGLWSIISIQLIKNQLLLISKLLVLENVSKDLVL